MWKKRTRIVWRKVPKSGQTKTHLTCPAHQHRRKRRKDAPSGGKPVVPPAVKQDEALGDGLAAAGELFKASRGLNTPGAPSFLHTPKRCGASR